MPRKMEESWANVVQNLNKSSQNLAKLFLLLHFWFYQNFISFHLGLESFGSHEF
jgi:hypothetical protein